ncbi:plasmid partition protein ParG [Rhodococcus rhodnii]|uniref:plasmid partition protein ParG n=1 Tax=Rhodococcus rhodnii TaxID=38312 RepID=UPI0009354977|nr:plasmid partition protein ParG [Rhodococcus rhodnii]
MSLSKSSALGPRSRPATTVPAAQSVESSFAHPDDDRTKMTTWIASTVHRRFKATAAAEGVKMRDVVEELVEEWIERHQPDTRDGAR